MDTLEAEIKHPHHYTQGGIQPLDFIVSNNMKFREGNIVKYVTRHEYKDGLKDCLKARQYIDDLIAEYMDDDNNEGVKDV